MAGSSLSQKPFTELSGPGFREALRPFASYRKCYGLITASMCHLPVVTEGFLLTGPIDGNTSAYLEEKYGGTVMCRVDAPFGQWGRIPRGRDIEVSRLNDYRERSAKSYLGSILLCFRHPSVFFTGRFIERWEIRGGINILIIWNSLIIIEYVGKGFDVGDLSRGICSSHQTIKIPWEIRNKNCREIWESSDFFTIPADKYPVSARDRVEALAAMGCDKILVAGRIPKTVQPISYSFFENLYYQCIKPVINKRKLFDENVSVIVQLNDYGDGALHVFDIWESDK